MANTMPRSIRVGDDLWYAARDKAQAEGVTLTEVVKSFLREYVETTR
jgi:antitoxin component of RelBE/YafQ-DinJ toxin-antitoxin module